MLVSAPGDIGQVTTPPTGCEICASTGDCSRAFRDAPGQFCGNWVDESIQQLPCCCPLNAVCHISPPSYTCGCTYAGVMPPYHSESDLVRSVLWLWWILGVLTVLFAFGGCCYLAIKLAMVNNNRRNPTELAIITEPLVSPVREGLIRSMGQAPSAQGNVDTSYGSCVPGSDLLEVTTGPELGKNSAICENEAFDSHNRPPDDCGVGGDGFDGGLGDLERAAKNADAVVNVSNQ